MKKLKVAFLKGFVFFIIASCVIVGIDYIVFTYLESEVFNGEVPYEYRLISFVIELGLLLLLAIPTMVKPARAINIEKDRRITQWGITGVRPENQKVDTRKK